MEKLLLGIVLLGFSLGCAHAGNDMRKDEKIDQYFKIIEKHQKAMGSVIVLDGEDVAYKRHFYFKSEPKNPIYRIGSLSKIYTATIILQLVEAGKLELETSVASFYPEIPQAKKITIEHLLRHRSGLPNYTHKENYEHYFESQVSSDRQIKRFSEYQLEFTPGEKYSYSNTGYALLTYIAEKKTGLSYQKLLEKFISVPLELEKTFVYDKKNPHPHEVRSYEKEIKWNESSNTHQSVSVGAGAMASTPLEVAKFLRSLLKGELISSALLEDMKDLIEGYGLGIMTFPYGKKTAWGHTGGIDGFRSIAGHFLKDDVTFVQLTNALDMTFNNISLALLSSHYGDDFNLPSFEPPYRVDTKVLKHYEGTYSGDSFPLKLSFYIVHGRLFGKASGQKEFLLKAISDTKFQYSHADVTLEFSSDGKTLRFTQGETFLLKKE